MPDLLTLPASDILYRCWLVPQPQAVLLLIHGMGAHSGRWEFLADYFTARNLAAYAPELKGWGETPGVRGHIDHFRTYYSDILKCREAVAQNHPGKKIFLLAESLGGLLAFNTAAQNPDIFSGLVLISPAFQNTMRFPVRDYLLTFSSLLFNPRQPIPVPFTAAMCTRDPAYQKIMESDPRELRTASAKTLINTLFAQMLAGRLAAALREPVLFLLAGRDYLVSPRASQRLFSRLPGRDKKLLLYPDMLHALSIDLGREQVFADIYEWLQKHL